MTFEDAKNYFGNKNRLGLAVGLKRSSIDYWQEKNFVPEDHQIEIFELSKGKLKPDDWIIHKNKRVSKLLKKYKVWS